MKTNDQIINNWFQEHPKYLLTWRSPRGDTKNQINNITNNKRVKNEVLYSKAYSSTNCETNHLPIICKQTKIKKIEEN